VLVGTATVTAGLATGALSGCSVFGGGKPAQPTISPSPELASLARERALSSERSLLAAYDATIARHPALASQLAPMRADHADHLDALQPESASGSPVPEPTGESTVEPPEVPADPKAALGVLVSAEREAAAERVADIGPLPARLAQLLASIGGSEAMHAALLGSA
jgi:hypothetical protein